MSKEKKISKEELEKLQAYVNGINEIQNNVGALEMQKHNALHKSDVMRKGLDAMQVDLEEKYGQVNISLATGVITEDADNPEA
jgi:hypothetical protein